MRILVLASIPFEGMRRRQQQVALGLAERGLPLGPAVKALLDLLDAYGAGQLESAVLEALEKGANHPAAVRHVLERRRHEAKGLPPIAIELPDDERVRELSVRPHALKDYDMLEGEPDADDDSEEEAPEPEGS